MNKIKQNIAHMGNERYYSLREIDNDRMVGSGTALLNWLTT